MTDLNSVNLIGRLTKDAELKYTNSGIAVSRISIAVNKTKMNDGQKSDEVSFLNVVLWGKIAESLNQYLLKGKQIAVSGELKQNRWEDQQGNKKSIVEVVANNIQLLGDNKQQGNSDQGNQQSKPRYQNNQQKPSANNFKEPEQDQTFDDDIPF